MRVHDEPDNDKAKIFFSKLSRHAQGRAHLYLCCQVDRSFGGVARVFIRRRGSIGVNLARIRDLTWRANWGRGPAQKGVLFYARGR